MDETGDHGLAFIDDNFPIFVLCGCLISARSLARLERELDEFREKYFSSTEVILHSRDIRKCEGAFQILFDLDVKARFYRDLNKIMDSTDFTIIGAAVNKTEHIKRYGKGAKDPYSLSLSFVLERLIFCLDGKTAEAKVRIKAEKRGTKEDCMLLADYNSILDRGTYYVGRERLASRIAEFKFHAKRENIVGLQLADLCAYPLARNIISPGEPYIPFNVIKEKIYCDKRGRTEGFGLKIFP